MKINGKIISSLQGLSKDFNFFEIWQKISVFKRDINPQQMYFSDHQKKLFNLFVDAENATTSESSIILGDFYLPLNDNQLDILQIDSLSLKDRIRVIALYTLVEKEIPLNQIKDLAKPISDYGDTILLSHGKSIPFGERQLGKELITRRILVLPTSPNGSYIGNLYLKPGEVTFGVFTEDGLIKVCSKELSNLSYHLQFHLLSNNKSKMVVTNLSTGSVIAEYPECTFFGTLHDDNFIVINKGNVDCFNDQHLMNIIRKKIGFIDEPQYFEISDSIITVILKNGEKVSINY